MIRRPGFLFPRREVAPADPTVFGFSSASASGSAAAPRPNRHHHEPGLLPSYRSDAYIDADEGVNESPQKQATSRSPIPTLSRSRNGPSMARAFNVQKLIKKLGFEKGDIYFVKQIRPKEEKEMAHLYERIRYPYPGDKEAFDEFVKSGGAIGTTVGPKGFIDSDKDMENLQKQLQSQKFEQEAQKLWFRMRNEVIQELQEKGFDVE